MLHFNVMKTLFFTFFAPFVIAGTAMAAPKVASPALDTVRTTYEDGRVSRIYTVLKGTDVREGASLSYHRNGKLAIEVPYRNGKIDGVMRSYDEEGRIHETIGYLEGEEEGYSTIYYANGKKKSRETYRCGILNGVSEDWDEMGRIRRQIPYVDGQIHGIVKIYDENGKIKEDMYFDHGLRNGAYRRYTFGKVTFEAEFKDNRCVKNCNF